METIVYPKKVGEIKMKRNNFVGLNKLIWSEKIKLGFLIGICGFTLYLMLKMAFSF